MSTTDSLKRAIELAGGQTELARKIGAPLKQGHISNWLARGKVPREYIGAIEMLTDGAVRCEDLDDEVEWERTGKLVTGYRVRVAAPELAKVA